MRKGGAGKDTSQVGGACVADDGGSGRKDGGEVGISVEGLRVAEEGGEVELDGAWGAWCLEDDGWDGVCQGCRHFSEACSKEGSTGGDTGEPDVKVRSVVAPRKEACEEEVFNRLIVKVRGAVCTVTFKFSDDNRGEIRVGRELRYVEIIIHGFLIYDSVE